MLFTHEQTLYSLLVPNLKKPEFLHLDDIFVQALFKQLRVEMFTQGQIESVLEEYDGKNSCMPKQKTNQCWDQ